MHENPSFLALRNVGQGHGSRHPYSDTHPGSACMVVYIVKSELRGVLYLEVNSKKKKKNPAANPH